MASNMTARVLVAAVGIPLALAVVWLGGWPLAGLIALVAVLGVRELLDIAEATGNRPLRPAAMVLAAGVPLVVHAALASPAVAAWLANWWVCLVGIGAVGLLAALLASRSPADRPLAAIGITLFAVTYAAALPAFLLGIRHGSWPTGSWGGTALVFFPLVVTWVTDTAAMFGGKAIGGPQLAPVISPGKTRAGGVAGLVGGALVGLLFATAVFPRVGVPLAVGPAIVVALLLAVVGQAGDLVESLFKREAGVKDSSGLIPGHGGVLDRFDSLYVVLPVAAACFRILGLI